MSVTGHWLDDGACINADSSRFHAANAAVQQQTIQDYCLGCQVRPECLADALATDQHQDHGVRGGTTRNQRLALRKRPDIPTGRDAVTIAALRQLLDDEQPNVPRHPAPRTPRRAAREKTKVYEKPTTTEAATEPETPATVEPAAAAPVRSISDLLDWAEQHTEAALRKHATAARAALAVIQQRHAADTELQKLHTEAEELRARLAELDARAKQLAPTKAQRDHDPKAVRAWAQEQGIECPRLGVVPKAVLAKWREATAA